MPGSAPPPAAAPAKPEHPATEAEYLQQQAALAKAALAGTIASLKSDVGETVDLRLWTRQHPWIMAMTAAVAGFATAAAVVPSKDEHHEKFLDSLKEAFHKATKHATNGSGKEKAEKAEEHHPGWGESILKELIGAIRPILISVISGLVKPAAPPPEPQDSANPAGAGGSVPPGMP